ncbi:MAG: D-serine ammonia-lyase [Clostridia bacterium]|nr:D-serine ammonia-lyase [Clostridia bacterium]
MKKIIYGLDENTTDALIKQKETLWINSFKLPYEYTKGLCDLVISDEDIKEAEALFLRFSPFIKVVFPETESDDGIIESPLTKISNMKKTIENNHNIKIPGLLYLKQDSHLKVAGSVKARGGFFEVLKYAEKLALSHGKIHKDDNYIKFASKEMKEFFSGYTIQVGSTGNLGMSIGIMSAALGFNVVIHMSADAIEWKKELLRNKGVKVIEYKSDYTKAVLEGRNASMCDPKSYFVDDEWSVNLFLGYAVAASRLKTQLNKNNILVDSDHPLFVYIPAGVGGAPGGISYGLKRLFGDNVHCFFAKPCLFPSVLLGISTQKFENVSVVDYGISGLTAAILKLRLKEKVPTLHHPTRELMRLLLRSECIALFSLL